jgi:hypothetical protein
MSHAKNLMVQEKIAAALAGGVMPLVAARNILRGK